MEQLSLLQKIYLYGETLSSEELNQIVLYLNSSIEAINTLIARNNNINEGHCEMRYKVSAQLPEAPESGTDGKSNGWSDTYTRPDTANGEITWMTLSFFNGEGVYGAWSTPVCITWGSVRGQAGPKGESGLKGSFKSRVFKRLNTRPDTPTGGTYDNPIPPSGGWTDGIPTGKAIIWSSVCTFYGNGLSSGWTVPASESDSDTLDIEFSPNAVQPEPPTGDTPYTNHESEGWYDPSSNQFNIVGTMIWRAERKVSNGVYNGDWTITRIVGEKGDRGDSGLTGGHYEFRYNNFKPSEQASAPTKPETGSNGTTGGWTTSQETLTETLIKEGYATWMTQCYQNEASTYGVWTDPIRITGANGEDGEDGVDIEFVYTRREDVWTNPTPPPTTQTDDWPTNGNNHSATVNGMTWYDNPLGVTEVLMYEYVSLRLKVDDVWSAYSTPVVWSKWGEKGMDGDGYEYIYKRFATPITWANADTASSGATQGGNDNPANWAIVNNKEYYGPTNYAWSDDPVGIDETYRYEYVSCRRRINELWGAYETPKLWSGVPGVFLSRVFTRTNDDISNVTPSGGTYTNPIPNNSIVGNKTYIWTDGVPNGEAIIWSSTCTFNWDGTNGGWSKPLKESDTANLDIEFTDVNSDNGSAAPTAPQGNTPFSNHSSENPAWYDPSSIPANKTMVWRAERKVANGVYVGNWVITRIKGEKGDTGDTGGNYEFRYANNTSSPTKPTAGTSGTTSPWSATQSALTEQNIKDGYKTWMTHCYKTAAGTYGTWSDPIRITGANGLDGEDGSDVEFIYKRNNTGSTPGAPTSVNTDDYIPDGWTDNPTGVAADMKYEYVAVREKPAGKNQSWGAYHVALWSKWGEKGMDGDGYEYIYKHFSSEQTWGANDNNPNNWAANLNREYYGPSGYAWSDDPTGVDSTNKYEYVSTRQRVDGTWLKFSTPVLWSNYAEAGATVQGPQGKLGPMSYLAGIWNENTTYTKTETKNPIVYYEDGDSYYYLVGTPPVSALGNSDKPSISSKWAEAENYNTVFTDILFVGTFSKLGHFIVNTDWLITMHGTIYDSSGTGHVINETLTWASGGTTYNLNNAYLLFDTEYPQSSKSGANNFVPNAAIDARTGESYFNKAHVTGEINATGGVFSGDVYANLFRAGNINGFNITVESDSINFNYGSSKQAWFSTKKLEMDQNGNIVDSGNDAPLGFYLYMISPKNGNIVTIDFDNLSFSEVVNNAVLVPVHKNDSLVKRITASSSGRASVSNTPIYYKNKDSLGNTITTQYYWDTECTNQITGALGAGYYVAVKTGYVVVNETVVLGGSPYVLRPVTIYLPATYISNAGIISGSGNRIFIIDRSSNNTDLVFVTGASSASTLYNSGVYYANTGTTLNNMSGPLQIASGSSSVSAYAANKSAGSTIPTSSGTLSVFTATGSSPMTKVNYSS